MCKNKYISRCPICNTGMHEENYQLDGYGSITCESREICPNCGFTDEFAYGGHRIGFELDLYESDYNLWWSFNNHYTKHEYRKFKNKMYGYRRRLLKHGKIKSLGNMKF